MYFFNIFTGRRAVLCFFVVFIVNVFPSVLSEEDEIIEVIPAVAPVSSPVILLRTKRQLPFLSNWWNAPSQKSKIESSLHNHKYESYPVRHHHGNHHRNRTSGVLTGNGVSERDGRCKWQK